MLIYSFLIESLRLIKKMKRVYFIAEEIPVNKFSTLVKFSIDSTSIQYGHRCQKDKITFNINYKASKTNNITFLFILNICLVLFLVKE